MWRSWVPFLPFAIIKIFRQQNKQNIKTKTSYTIIIYASHQMNNNNKNTKAASISTHQYMNNNYATGVVCYSKIFCIPTRNIISYAATSMQRTKISLIQIFKIPATNPPKQKIYSTKIMPTNQNIALSFDRWCLWCHGKLNPSIYN